MAGGTYLSGATAWPSLAPHTLVLGNGLTTSYAYDTRQRIQSIQTGTLGNPSAQNLTLGYDEANNVNANGNQVGSGNDAFTFDAENRLAKVRGARPYSTASACGDYDDDGQTSTLDLSRMASHFGQTRASPGYDFRMDLDWDGTITVLDMSRQANRCTIGPSNMQHTDYVYDGNGSLLKRTNTDTSAPFNAPASTWTVYIGGIFEKNFSSATGATYTTKYYIADGRAIAVGQTPVGGAETVTYLLADHLGSTVGSTDQNGDLIGVQLYWPYGASRYAVGSLATDRMYTGQQQEDTGPRQDATNALGLYNYKARFYSTVTGRFVSADSLTNDGLNRYAYARSNPLRYTDPTGRCVLGLPCDAPTALSWLACANSVDGCAAVFQARGIDAEPDLIERVHRLAEALIPGEEFQNNYSDPRNNPYVSGASLQSAFGSYPVDRLFTFANSVVEEMLGLGLWPKIEAALKDPYNQARLARMAAFAAMGAACGGAVASGGSLTPVCVASVNLYAAATVTQFQVGVGEGGERRNGWRRAPR